MKLTVITIADGLHPSEVLVKVETRDGIEEMIVDRRAIFDDAVEIGSPLGHEKGYTLVELPRETMRGAWRVWVPQGNVVEGMAA